MEMKKIGLLILISMLLFACGKKNTKKDYVDEMAEQHKNDVPVANAESLKEPQGPVKSERVEYATVDGTKITGYLAHPDAPNDSLPAMIVIHEWWGLNKNIESMADQLAGEGYVALAVDLYNGKSAEKPEQAMELMRNAMNHPENGISNLKQAYSYLHDHFTITKTGVIGWCFGGGWSLRTALAMPDKIDATVIYYGQLVTDAKELKTLKMPIYGFFGGEDPSIPKATIEKFKSTLDSLGGDVQVKIYPDASHAFANPSGTRYNKLAAEDAWNRTLMFLNRNLKGS